MILRVTKYGEPVLREVGKPVTVFDGSLKQLAQDMIETMHDTSGVGLAAQQVGQALQLFVMDLGSETDCMYALDGRQPPLGLIMPMAVANPKLNFLDDYGKEPYDEGCLSFPGMLVEQIKRPVALEMEFQDLDGAPHHLVTEGFFARVIQHEYDHLQGTLFIDRATKKEVRRHQAHLNALLEETEAFLKSEGRDEPVKE